MTFTPDQYEKLGAFYLGRGYDLESRQLQDELIMYDSKDLVTHGLVLGMTGSGKTGLCLALLEEAAMDGIPVIAIDPKGDIGNVMLTFPELSAAEFEPWVNADDARRKDVSVPEYAAAQSELWKKGLGEWGQDAARIRKLRETVDMAIYTPGSNAGLPVSILSSLDCPPASVMEDAETLGDRIESTVSSLLGLMGVESDPVQSPEHILLSNIVAWAWKKGQNVSLENLVRHIQQPPVRKIGVMDLESFFPEARRTALAMKLNNLIASPGFAAWLEGEPLDIQRMFYTREGKPRVTVFNISHLGDGERMFFVSLLLNQLLGWMRSQQGTTSLRALFYMDEIYGYLPPTAMPPSKKPLMILLKQARAFGLGLLLATQNPVDLDYKALANMGTWWIGRLQTERDKARLLDGLEGAAGGQFDRKRMETAISGLGNRVFLMNNVHEDGPAVFHVRWVMSYLSGPLAREQVKRLMDPLRPAGDEPAPDAEDAGFLPPGATAAPAATDRNTVKPRLPEGTAEYFLAAADVPAESLCYVPAILRSAEVVFDDSRRKISGRETVTLVNPIENENHRVLWDKFVDLPRDSAPAQWESAPQPDAEFAELPGAAMKSTTYTAIRKDFVEWVYGNHAATLHHCPLLEAYSNPGEPLDEFKARITLTSRERRDQAIEELRTKTAKAQKTLEDRAFRAQTKVDTQKSQATSAKLSTAVSIGSSLLGAFFGRKGGLSGLARSSTVTGAARVMRESQDVAAAEAELARVQAEQQELETRLAADLQNLRDQYDPSALVMETVKLTPVKSKIQPTAIGILWLPHERAGGQLRPAWS